jgi:DNA repair protein RadA/Sms
MAGKDTIFFCTDCGHESSKWLGQCPGCESWNSFAEEPRAPKKKRGAKAPSQPRRGARAVPVTEAAAAATDRVSTGLDGVDRVLGGGLVPGYLILVAG